MKQAEEQEAEFEKNLDGGDLLRKSTFIKAKSQMMSMAEEEEAKKKLIEEQKTQMSENHEQMLTHERFSIQPTVLEQEFF